MNYFLSLQVEFYGDSVAVISKQRGMGSENDEQNLLTQIDTDAENLEIDRRLHPLRKEDEMRLIRLVFSRLFYGQLGEAQHLCFRAGQPFRAAMFEAWKLFHNPNMKLDNDVSNIKGNRSIVIIVRIFIILIFIEISL